MGATATVNDGPVTATGPLTGSPDRAARVGLVLLLYVMLRPALYAAVVWLTSGAWVWTLGALVAFKALLVLPQLVHSLPRLRKVRDRYWPWTLSAMVLLTFGPCLAFGTRWNAGGFVVASVLLLFPAPRSWLVLTLVLAVQAGFLLAYGADAGLVTLTVIDGALVTGLALYVLTRLVDVLGELRDTRAATARVVTGQERLRAARELFGRLGPRLSRTARTAERASRIAGSDPATASASVVELGRLARQALSDVREAARTFRDGDPDGTAGAAGARTVALTSTEPRLAFVLIVVMSLTGALANLVNIITKQQPGPALAVAAAAGLATLVGLQIYHAAPRIPSPAAAPRGLWWTLPVQLLLVFLPVPVFGTNWIGMSAYLAACVLIVLRPPVSWLAFAAITAAMVAVLVTLPGGSPVPASPVFHNVVDWLLADVWTVGIFIAPMLLAASVVRLRAARAELVRMTLVRERLAVARDVHDLLGSSLSAVALKADLASRLLHRDPARAQTELADAANLARRAITEARALSGEQPDTSLALELASARSMLAAASIRAEITPFPGGLPVQADTALAIVVREAITNVLRHSAAQHCTISFSLDDDTAKLHITNDGAATPRNGSGTGIGNLSARIHALGGRLSAARRGEQGFSLRAEVPISGAEPA